MPHHRQNCNTRFITDPSELELAKHKLLNLAQSELFSDEVNALHNEQFKKKSSQIAFFVVHRPRCSSVSLVVLAVSPSFILTINMPSFYIASTQS